MSDLSYTLYHGDCLEIMKTMPDNSVDSIVTDPPAGISFMNKAWDRDKGGRDKWIEWLTGVMAEAKRLLKPGGHALVWAIPRTSHWTAMAVENAGFEIRDIVHHLFGSGFPKSANISKHIDKMAGAEREVVGINDKQAAGFIRRGRTDEEVFSGKNVERIPDNITVPATPEAKQWDGWGTALKPAVEHWILARKPLSEKSIAANVLEWGTGGLNIDECRVGTETRTNKSKPRHERNGFVKGFVDGTKNIAHDYGRFPANLVHDGSDVVVNEFPVTGPSKRANRGIALSGEGTNDGWKRPAHLNYEPGIRGHNDNGGSAARFFYCAKPSKSDRNDGLGGFDVLFDSIELIWYDGTDILNSKLEEVLLWEKQGQNQNMVWNGEALPIRGILEDTTAKVDGSGWHITSNGSDTMALYLTAIKFTTSTGIRQTIELKTLKFLQHSNTKDFTVDAIATGKEYGLNPVESVAFINLLKVIITNGGMVYHRGVKNVARRTQQLISAKEVLKNHYQRNGNTHNTVKSTELMRYLCRLITPPNGIVLDPFMGSGSTGKACKIEGFSFIGIDLEEEYVNIARARIDYAKYEPKQKSLFDL